MTEIASVIVPLLFGAASAALLAAGYWFSNKYQPNTAVDWKMVGSYMIVGAGLGVFETYMGVPVTFESLGVMLVANAGLIALVDSILSGIFKAPATTFVIKYTGHNYFPEFILDLKDGTTQKFNNSLTGICCSVWVVMPGKVARFVMPRLAAWYPGFTVTPAFLQGTSPYKFALNVVTGMDSDGTPLKQMKIDWKDGSPIEIVPLALNKDGNPAATVGHTYVFNGN